MNIHEEIINALNTDDSFSDFRLTAFYEKQTIDNKEIIDNFMRHLCGYSFHYFKTKKEEYELNKPSPTYYSYNDIPF